MKKVIKDTSQKGIIQITIADERWYVKYDKEGNVEKYVPSVSWIAGHYPKGVAFYKWLAQKGWDESQAIKQAAGDKGSKVHKAIEDLIDGVEVKMDSKYYSELTDSNEELTLEEYEVLLSFVDWWNVTKPKTIQREFVVFSKDHDYAGTVDWVGTIEGVKWMLDWKTSQHIWPEYELQISAYNKLVGADKMGILQLGYRLNKRGWKLNEIPDKFNLFLAAREIWSNESAKIQPKKRDYPVTLKLDVKKHVKQHL